MKHSRLQASINHKKGVPSEINKAFKRRKIDAAFVSSVEASRYKSVKLGIIAKKEVYSVLVIPGESKEDTASASSNALAKILKQEGQVLIGDKALAYKLSHDDGIDLAKLWYETYHLPFVFATLSYHSHAKQLKNISKKFGKSQIKIPQYIIIKASKKTGIKVSDIQEYLTKISYTIDYKAEKSLKKFINLKRSLDARN